MKRVLFTIQWYPSFLSANALCDMKIINRLLEDDYQVTCLAYKSIDAPDIEIGDKLRVYRFSRGVWSNTVIKAHKTNHLLHIINILDRIMLRIRQILSLPFYPDSSPITSLRFAAIAERLYNEEPFDIVISEYHGFDSLHAGSTLKSKHPNIKFVPILWDPFTGKEPAKYLPRRFAERRLNKSETKELQNADAIVLMESSRKYHIINSINKLFYDRFVYLDIPGVVRPAEVTTDPCFIKRGKINMIFAGIVDKNMRNPEYIINVINHTKQVESIRIIFFCIGSAVSELKCMAETSRCEIIVSGYISREQLNATYKAADVLLNIGNKESNMVPSKIFEYLSYGIPILSTYCQNDDTSKEYLDRYPLACCVDQRKPVEESAERIEAFLSETLGKTVPFEWVENEFCENTPKAYVDLIEKVLKK